MLITFQWVSIKVMCPQNEGTCLFRGHLPIIEHDGLCSLKGIQGPILLYSLCILLSFQIIVDVDRLRAVFLAIEHVIWASLTNNVQTRSYCIVKDMSVPPIIDAYFSAINSHPVVIISYTRRRSLHICSQKPILTLINTQNSFMHRQNILTRCSRKSTSYYKNPCMLQKRHPVTQIIVGIERSIKTILLKLVYL